MGKNYLYVATTILFDYLPPIHCPAVFFLNSLTGIIFFRAQNDKFECLELELKSKPSGFALFLLGAGILHLAVVGVRFGTSEGVRAAQKSGGSATLFLLPTSSKEDLSLQVSLRHL